MLYRVINPILHCNKFNEKNKSKMVDEVREMLAASEYAYFPTIYPANKKFVQGTFY